jgi:hypothetical protein
MGPERKTSPFIRGRVRSSANDNNDCDDSSTSSDIGRASATSKDRSSAAKAAADA